MNQTLNSLYTNGAQPPPGDVVQAAGFSWSASIPAFPDKGLTLPSIQPSAFDMFSYPAPNPQQEQTQRHKEDYFAFKHTSQLVVDPNLHRTPVASQYFSFQKPISSPPALPFQTTATSAYFSQPTTSLPPARAISSFEQQPTIPSLTRNFLSEKEPAGWASLLVSAGCTPRLRTTNNT